MRVRSFLNVSNINEPESIISQIFNEQLLSKILYFSVDNDGTTKKRKSVGRPRGRGDTKPRAKRTNKGPNPKSSDEEVAEEDAKKPVSAGRKPRGGKGGRGAARGGAGGRGRLDRGVSGLPTEEDDGADNDNREDSDVELDENDGIDVNIYQVILKFHIQTSHFMIFFEILISLQFSARSGSFR